MSKFIKYILIILLAVAGYGITEHHETRLLIDTANRHIDDGDHIRQFWAIYDTKDIASLHARTQQAVAHFAPAKDAFGSLTLYTPTARAIRAEYLQGLHKLDANLTTISHAKTQSTAQNELAKLHQQVRQSEQTLLNARERLANLSARHLLSSVLKMG